jgi:hypothetical protein
MFVRLDRKLLPETNTLAYSALASLTRENMFSIIDTKGLYYKHVMIANDDSRVVSKWSFKLIDDLRVIIYDRHRFIIQATALPTNVRLGLKR